MVDGAFIAPAQHFETSDVFTGQFDKVGKPIFQRDILKNTAEKMAEVQYVFGSFCLFLRGEGEMIDQLYLTPAVVTDFEVIGNMAENSELLYPPVEPANTEKND